MFAKLNLVRSNSRIHRATHVTCRRFSRRSFLRHCQFWPSDSDD